MYSKCNKDDTIQAIATLNHCRLGGDLKCQLANVRRVSLEEESGSGRIVDREMSSDQCIKIVPSLLMRVHK